MSRKRRKKSLLSRLLEEVENFLQYYESRERLEKGIGERKIHLLKPPKAGWKPHPLARQLITQIIRSKLLGRLKELEEE